METVQNQSSNQNVGNNYPVDSFRDIASAIQELRQDLQQQNDQFKREITNQLSTFEVQVTDQISTLQNQIATLPQNNNTSLIGQVQVEKSKDVPNWLDRFIVEVSHLFSNVFFVHSKLD